MEWKILTKGYEEMDFSKEELNILKHALGKKIRIKQEKFDAYKADYNVEACVNLECDLRTERILYKKIRVALDRYYGVNEDGEQGA